MIDEVDILYIHPTRSFENTKYGIMPVGIIALLNLLRNNDFSVKAINLGIEKSINNKYSLMDELNSLDYKFLLVDLHWYEHSYGAIQVANLSKALYPNKSVVIGGFTSTIFANEILKEFKCIDYVIKGDNEEPLKLLADFLINKQGNLVSIPNICYRMGEKIINKNITYHCSEIDSLDYVTYDFIKNKEYHHYTTIAGVNKIIRHSWLFVARGCIYNCSYCDSSNKNSEALFGRKNVISRSENKVAEDIEKLYEDGVQLICPTHDFQILGKKYYKKLFALIRAKNIKPEIYMECFQLPSEDFILELKNTFEPSSIRLAITPLSGDEEVRSVNGKNFTNNEFIKMLNFLLKEDINVELYYSLNLPRENKESFKKTLEQMNYISQKFPNKFVTIKCEKVMIDPLAPMRESNDIIFEINTFMDYYNYCKLDDDSNILGYTDKNTFELENRINKVKIWRKQITKKQNNRKYQKKNHLYSIML